MLPGNAAVAVAVVAALLSPDPAAAQANNCAAFPPRCTYAPCVAGACVGSECFRGEALGIGSVCTTSDGAEGQCSDTADCRTGLNISTTTTTTATEPETVTRTTTTGGRRLGDVLLSCIGQENHSPCFFPSEPCRHAQCFQQRCYRSNATSRDDGAACPEGECRLGQCAASDSCAGRSAGTPCASPAGPCETGTCTVISGATVCARVFADNDDYCVGGDGSTLGRCNGESAECIVDPGVVTRPGQGSTAPTARTATDAPDAPTATVATVVTEPAADTAAPNPTSTPAPVPSTALSLAPSSRAPTQFGETFPPTVPPRTSTTTTTGTLEVLLGGVPVDITAPSLLLSDRETLIRGIYYLDGVTSAEIRRSSSVQRSLGNALSLVAAQATGRQQFASTFLTNAVESSEAQVAIGYESAIGFDMVLQTTDADEVATVVGFLNNSAMVTLTFQNYGGIDGLDRAEAYEIQIVSRPTTPAPELNKVGGETDGDTAAVVILALLFVALFAYAAWYTYNRRRQTMHFPAVKNPASADDVDGGSGLTAGDTAAESAAKKRPDSMFWSEQANFPKLEKLPAALAADQRDGFFSVGNAPMHKSKNRDPGAVLPYNSTRVALKPLARVPNSGYVNASFVPSNDRYHPYIIAQGPFNHDTSQDFWRMIWEQQVTTVAMVASFEENGSENIYVHRYVPQDVGASLDFGGCTVTLTAKYEQFAYTHSVLKIKEKRSGIERVVNHVQFDMWPNHGVPTNTTATVRRFWRNIRRFHRSGPLVIHSSAGGGRAGCFACIDTCIRKYQTNKPFSVRDHLIKMRKCRPDLIENDVQYAFVHKAIVDFIENAPAVPVSGLPAVAGDFLRTFTAVPAPHGPFDIGLGGRRILRAGQVMWSQGNDRPKKAMLVLCNDVVFLCRTDEDGMNELAMAPAHRSTVSVVISKSKWNLATFTLRVKVASLGARLFGSSSNLLGTDDFALQAADVADRATWVEALSSREQLIATEDLQGDRSVPPKPSSVEEAAILLGVPNPYTAEGQRKLGSEFASVPASVEPDASLVPQANQHGGMLNTSLVGGGYSVNPMYAGDASPPKSTAFAASSSPHGVYMMDGTPMGAGSLMLGRQAWAGGVPTPSSAGTPSYPPESASSLYPSGRPPMMNLLATPGPGHVMSPIATGTPAYYNSLHQRASMNGKFGAENAGEVIHLPSMHFPGVTPRPHQGASSYAMMSPPDDPDAYQAPPISHRRNSLVSPEKNAGGPNNTASLFSSFPMDSDYDVPSGTSSAGGVGAALQSAEMQAKLKQQATMEAEIKELSRRESLQSPSSLITNYASTGVDEEAVANLIAFYGKHAPGHKSDEDVRSVVEKIGSPSKLNAALRKKYGQSFDDFVTELDRGPVQRPTMKTWNLDQPSGSPGSSPSTKRERRSSFVEQPMEEVGTMGVTRNAMRKMRGSVSHVRVEAAAACTFLGNCTCSNCNR